MANIAKITLPDNTTYDIKDKNARNFTSIPYYKQDEEALMFQLGESYMTEVQDNQPYLFRAAGGSANIGNREYDKIIGGTVCWNQKLNFASPSIMNQTYVSFDSNTGIYTITFPVGYASAQNVLYWTKGKIGFIKGHVYYLYVKVVDDTKWAPNCFIFKFPGIRASYYQNIYTLGVFSTSQPYNQGMFANSSTVDYFAVAGPSTAQQTEVSLSFIPVVIDVTQLLGPNVADALADVTDNISFKNAHVIKELFPRDYYTYNAGTLLSVKALSHDMIGFNAYDNTTGQAKVVGGCVYQITGAYTAISLDGETITPDTDGYFTPSQSGILTVTGGDAATTCVHLKGDGKKDGEWEPYVKHSYPLDPNLELRGIPMLDANNELYYDGDTYEADGTVTRKYGIVDLGTLNWTYRNEFFRANPIGYKKPSSQNAMINAICNGYMQDTWNHVGAGDKEYAFSTSINTPEVIFKNTAYSDAAAFKTAMSGVYLVYELATPTTETAEPYDNPQIVAPEGTEEYITTSIIPVGHKTRY